MFEGMPDQGGEEELIFLFFPIPHFLVLLFPFPSEKVFLAAFSAFLEK